MESARSKKKSISTETLHNYYRLAAKKAPYMNQMDHETRHELLNDCCAPFFLDLPEYEGQTIMDIHMDSYN